MPIKKILFSLLIFLAVYFLPKAIFAQTPTVPLANCGFADVQGANACCKDKIVTNQDFENAKKSLNNPAAQTAVDLTERLYQASDFEQKIGINNVIKKCYLGDPDESSGACICKQSNKPTPVTTLQDLCKKYVNNDSALKTCNTCVQGGGIPTDIGCVPLNLGNFITDFLLGRLIGLAGIIALICIIYAAFTLQTSQGNPEKVKKAQELLTSCIMGLMLIIFSVFILRFVGVDLLKIPGLK